MHKKKPQPNYPINTRLYYEAAQALKIPAYYDPVNHYVQLKLGKSVYYFDGCSNPINLSYCFVVGETKCNMNYLLSSNGFPVAKAKTITRHMYEYGSWDLGDLKYPLVAKPTVGTFGGRDVLCNIKTKKILTDHLDYCFEDYPMMSIEEFHGGLRSYRVLILDNKLIGLLERIPAQVIGDGMHTLAELMRIENERRAPFIGKLSIDELAVNLEYEIRMEELGITLETVIEKGKKIVLCYTSNALLGGTMEALDTALICKENKQLCLEAARCLNLKMVGFDLECKDISVPMMRPGSTDIFIEANSCPDISIHEQPLKGPTNRVSFKVYESLLRRHPIEYLKYRLRRILG